MNFKKKLLIVLALIVAAGGMGGENPQACPWAGQ